MNGILDPILLVRALFHRRYRGTVTVVRTILAVLLVVGSTSAAHASELSDRLVGSWSLASRHTVTTDGKELIDQSLSAKPRGILIYDRSGHVAAQLSRPGRTVVMLPEECAAAEKIKGTSDTAQTVLGYDAYFGTYTLDEARGIVTHHLESALFPGDIGKNITRRFKLDGDTLTIQFDTSLADGTKVTRTLVWTRLK